jgi:hypothetical protein
MDIVFQPNAFRGFSAYFGGMSHEQSTSLSRREQSNEAAVQRVMEYCNTQISNSPDPTIDARYIVKGGCLLEPGIFDLENGKFGSGGANLNFVMRGCGVDLSTFNIASGEPLIEEAGLVICLDLRDFSISGGPLLHHTNTGINTTGLWKLIDNIGMNDAPSGIVLLSEDNPNWSISRINSRGVLRPFITAGLADAVHLEKWTVTGHQYGFILGGATTGNNVRIVDCSFFDFADVSTDGIDIMFVPGASAVLSRGALIEKCKFGNEFRNASDFYVAAAEMLGDLLTGTADFTTASTGFVGFDAVDNAIYGAGAGTRAFFHSMTPNRNVWIGPQTMAGTPLTLVELAAAARNQGTAPHSNRVLVEATNLPLYADTNVDVVKGGGVMFVDPTGAVTGGNNISAARHGGTDPGCTELIATSINGGAGWLNNGSASAASAGTDAVEITYAASTGAYYYTLPTPITADRNLFIEFDVEPGSSLALGYGVVQLLDNNTGTVAVWKKRFKIGSALRTISVEIPPLIDNPGGNPFATLAFYPGDYAGGSKTKMKIGRPRLYHAGNPVNRWTKALPETTQLWDPGSIANGAKEGVDVSLPGLRACDRVVATFSLDLQDMVLSAAWKSNNVARATLSNNTGGAIDLAQGTLRTTAFKAGS